jgi:diguanylate cyclase (GGDEF)-like protein
MLGVLADTTGEDLTAEGHNVMLKDKLLNSAFQHLTGFQSLVLLSPDGRVLSFASRDALPAESVPAKAYATESCFLHTRDTSLPALSNIKISPISGKPTLLMSQPVVDARGRIVAVLLGELRIDLIESLRAKIHFGTGGHSAIVDKKGHVIAHPNAAWMADMHDLSSWPVVQEALANKSGVMEFHSSFTHADMVAGYATVPEIGWGILVPQPKAEIEARIDAVLWSHLSWGVAGVALALLLALLLARWITRPIRQLAAHAVGLADTESKRSLNVPARGAPREIEQLAQALSDTLAGLRASRLEVVELNQSLQRRVESATEQLQQANTQLQVLASYDHLTSIANRRHFETTLDNTLRRRARDAEPANLMLIDVDNFKEINDRFGHPAGDAVLVQLAGLLQTAMRTDDLVARYGGDEFVALMRCPPDIARRRAEDILAAIESNEFLWDNKVLRTTVSIGLLCCENDCNGNIDALLCAVDAALYDAKQRGRNRVVTVTL